MVLAESFSGSLEVALAQAQQSVVALDDVRCAYPPFKAGKHTSSLFSCTASEHCSINFEPVREVRWRLDCLG
ncbi:MAG: hypothetical protein ACRESZ_13545 [Methylococcales bacterium]